LIISWASHPISPHHSNREKSSRLTVKFHQTKASRIPSWWRNLFDIWIDTKKHWFHRNCLRTHPFYLNINQIQIFSFLLKVPRQSKEGRTRNIWMKFESIFIEIVSIMKLSYFFIGKSVHVPQHHISISLYFAFCQPNVFILIRRYGVCTENFLCLFCIQIISSVWTTNEYPFRGDD
jgi:hypothetical protein